ncbi:DUF1330 domain-containing protein [Xanthomonas euvesicatoria]
MLAACGELEVLEGETPEGIVLVSFPTMQDAKSWYYSEEYQAALSGARYLTFLVEGLPVNRQFSGGTVSSQQMLCTQVRDHATIHVGR